jgi:ABC-2 type transport system permease protein
VTGTPRVIAALGRRALKQTMRRPQLLAPIVIFPSLLLAVNTGGAGRAVDIPGFPDVHGFLDFELAGAMLQSSLLVGVSAGIALAIDVEMGFIDRLISAPVARSVVVSGRLVATGVLGMFVGVWFLSAGLIFGAHIKGGVLGVLIVLGLLALAAMSFGGLGAALALKSGRASVVQSVFPLVFVVLFMSSAFFPRQLMEEPASTIAKWNPLTLIAEGLRGPIIHDVTLASLGKGLAGVAIVASLSAVLSALALRSRLRAA